MTTKKINSFDLLLQATHSYSAQVSINSLIERDFANSLHTLINRKVSSYYSTNKFKSLQFKALGSFIGVCSETLFGESTELTPALAKDLIEELRLS